MTFKVAWTEALLSIIHSLLDSKVCTRSFMKRILTNRFPNINCYYSIDFFFQLDLSEELFTQFTEQLVSQGPHFTKSVKFAKMMLTVLTKYSSNVSLHSSMHVFLWRKLWNI